MVMFFQTFPMSLMFFALTLAFILSNMSFGEHDQHSFANALGNVTNLIEQAVVLNSLGSFDDALPILDKALSKTQATFLH